MATAPSRRRTWRPSALRRPARRAPAVAAATSTMRFITDRRTVTALENVSFSRRARRVPHAARAVGLRQVHAAARGRRPDRADQRAASGARRRAAGGAAAARDSASCSRTPRCCPGAPRSQNVELPLEVGGRRRCRTGAPTPRELLELVGLKGWENSLSARALRRHAPARLDRARAARRAAASC